MTKRMDRRTWWGLGVCGLLLVAAVGGCTQKPPPVKPRWTELPAKEVPAFLKGTVLELAELQNTDAFVVSGYGLVTRLRGTGDSTAPTAVREFMIKEMARRGFGSPNGPYKYVSPEDMLRDPTVAIAQVDGAIPPGARVGQRIDVVVSALESPNNTTSLAHGQVFQCDLRIMGADRQRPGGSVNTFVRVDEGQVFVNPFYSAAGAPDSPQAKASLRQGVVMDAGRILNDRPLALRLRRPQYSMTRAIQTRLNQAEMFQKIADKTMPAVTRETPTSEVVAAAKDEAIVYLYVPRSYRGDWQHFAEVAMHSFLNGSPAFLTAKARELAAEAVKPDAKLKDISYCWEAIGQPALQFIQPLMTHSSPEVAYAAARAAAFIGDTSAQVALIGMARTPNHPFQINAVQTLGGLPETPAVSQMLRELLDTDQTMVRLEAYRILSRQNHSSIFSKVIQEKFVLDYVPCSGPPMVYATRNGVPRIAIFGDQTKLGQPITFTSMNSAFSISSGDQPDVLTLFYRGEHLLQPVKQLSRPDLREIVARLGGASGEKGNRFDLSYSDIVGVLHSLSNNRKITAPYQQKNVAVSFVLQELPGQEDRLYNAPIIPGGDEADPDKLPDLKASDPRNARSGERGTESRPQ